MRDGDARIIKAAARSRPRVIGPSPYAPLAVTIRTNLWPAGDCLFDGLPTIDIGISSQKAEGRPRPGGGASPNPISQVRKRVKKALPFSGGVATFRAPCLVGYSSGQRGQTVNLLGSALHWFESSSYHHLRRRETYREVACEIHSGRSKHSLYVARSFEHAA
jgi:hypothetical protein